MLRLAMLVTLVSACSFRAGVANDANGNRKDAGNGSSADDGSGAGGSDGSTLCVPGFVNLCSLPPPTMQLNVITNDTINTDTDPRCVVVTQAVGRAVCVVNATSVSIAAGSALIGIGSRPLAIRSTSTMTIDGVIDVGSYRGARDGAGANDDACALGAQAAEDDPGGAAGAAGGSFGGVGGVGGTGDTDSSLGNDGTALPGQPGIAVTSLAHLRGGCPGGKGGNESSSGGQGGDPAAGGGALYVVAPTSIVVSSSGRIRATGAGGNPGQTQSGGGGAGSGGLVVIESAMITVAGMIAANGGGGGEGGARISSTDTTGNPGFDGNYGNAQAAGGSGIDNRMGYGGPGGAGATPDGTIGVSSLVGGGGGGGAVGFVLLRGASTITNVVSPPAQ